MKLVDAKYDVGVLLVELRNGLDPHSSVKQELCFSAWRFALQEEISERVSDHAEDLVPA